jgi:hypothetical protein
MFVLTLKTGRFHNNVSAGAEKGQFHGECVATLLLGRQLCSGRVTAMNTAERE